MTTPNYRDTTDLKGQAAEAQKKATETQVGITRGPTKIGMEEFKFLSAPLEPHDLGQLGGYRVTRVIGRGGMGVVFEGIDPMLGRHVAIKVPLENAQNDVYRARFLREARTAATLPTEHIATVYQVGQQGDTLFLVMELLHGESLEKRLDRERTLPVLESLRIAREIAEGLREAHNQGLVHRDIKPANIWLEQRDGRPGPAPVKILDFGLAREARPEQGITSPGLIVGTIGYMAPEQIFAGDLDGRTDLFALGCLLYEMLSGRLPFASQDTATSLKAVVYETAKPLAKAAPFLPESVCRLVDDLLQKEPSARPASASIVVERIAQIEKELTRQTTPARPQINPGPPAREKMSRSAFYGASIVMLAVLVGLTVLVNKLRRPLSEPSAASQIDAPVVPFRGPPIKVGILHSLTGRLAASETPLVESALLAIDEINAKGGVLGHKLEPVVVDGRSEEEGFISAATELIEKDKVPVIFGCWSSPCRKRVEGVCRERNNLLVYSLSYEGLEDSPYVMYVGGGPNQQLIPAVGWAVGLLGKRRFFMVGSEDVYARSSIAIMSDKIKDLNAEVVGEAFLNPHENVGPRFVEIAEQIKKSGADAVLSTVDGLQANSAFFQALAAAGITADKYPIISFALYETELRHLDERVSKGHFAVANYFESMETPENAAFLKRFKARHATRVVTDPIVSTYGAIYIWKQAVEEAGTADPPAVRTAMTRQKFQGPEGLIAMDPGTQHAMRTARVGKVISNREFEVVFASPKPLPPVPFPVTRTRKQWEEFLADLYRRWNNHWEEERR